MTDFAKKNYIDGQLYKASPISPEHCESRKIQLRTELGHSNWLDITPEQWRKIETVLRGES
jgi:hypothetical protein